MNPQSTIPPSSILFLSFFLLISSATCFNITKIFDHYPDYSTFNQYLTKTHLADEINKRQTITVLAVPNSAIGPLTSQSEADIKKILSLHVVLDYYDVEKLQKLSKKTALLTTLFQSSGQAAGQQGFLNATDFSSGEIALGSAVKGSSLYSKLVRTIAAKPYNISVLEVTSVIIPSGIGNGQAVSAPPAGAPKSSKVIIPDAAEAPVAEAPADDEASAPTTDAPSPSPDADGPTADSPLSSPPSPSPADAPASEAPGADAPDADAKGAGARIGSGLFVAVLMVALSSLVAL